MKLAITTDWLVTPGGAERVIAEMLSIWPEAPVFTTVYNGKRAILRQDPGQAHKRNEVIVIPVPTLQRRYAVLRSHRPLIFSMPRAVESWDLRGFDTVLSSSHAVAKGCITPDTACHICYCHTPMRYAWDMEERYLDDFKLHGPLRSLVKRQLKNLRRWDLSTAKRVDLFIANSRTTQERIRRIYGRDSIVLHPPVDDRFFEASLRSSHDVCRGARHSGRPVQEMPAKKFVEAMPSTHLRPVRTARPGGQGYGGPARTLFGTGGQAGRPEWRAPLRTTGGQYFLAVGRLVPYKRFDVLIEAANAGRFPLKIAGDGPDGARLKRLAGPTVEFLGHVPEDQLPALYGNARATIFPAHEDAGIVPLESQACGTPVIALGKGGALETVCGVGGPPAHTPGSNATGIFFEEQTVGSLTGAIRRLETVRFDPQAIREHARQFSSRRFREELEEIVRITEAKPR